MNNLFVPKTLEAYLPTINGANIRLPQGMEKQLEEMFLAAFKIAQEKVKFSRDRRGENSGYTYNTKGISLEGIGATFFQGQVIYNILHCPAEGMTVYDLLPTESNELVVMPDTLEVSPRDALDPATVARMRPITAVYTDEQAQVFRTLYNLAAFNESNFARHDHDLVRDCVLEIGNLPYLAGEHHASVIYNAIVFYAYMSNLLWFDNYTEAPRNPADPAHGLIANFERIDLVQAALATTDADAAALINPFRCWLSSTLHLELAEAMFKFSTERFKGDVTLVGYNIPDSFFQTFVTGLLKSLSAHVRYSMILDTEGESFFRELPRVSRIMKAIDFEPKLKSSIEHNVKDVYKFGFFNGVEDLTPSLVNDFLTSFNYKHSNIIPLWEKFIENFYHKPGQVEMLPIVGAYYSINSHGQKEVYSHYTLPPYDRMATRVNTYPDGEQRSEDMFASIPDGLTRFISTERIIRAYLPEEEGEEITVPPSIQRGDTEVIFNDGWEMHPRLLELIRRSLYELEVRIINDQMTSVDIRYYRNAYLLIPKMNMQLPYVINFHRGIAQNPYSWNKVRVNVDTLTAAQLAFAFTRNELAKLALDNITDDAQLEKLYLDRLSKLVSGKILGHRTLVVLPPITRATLFSWNAFVATSMPLTAAKCLHKVRVSCNYDELNNLSPANEILLRNGAVSLTLPRRIVVPYPVNLSELSTQDREAVAGRDPNFRRTRVLRYSDRCSVDTRQLFAEFMPDYQLGLTEIELDDQFFINYGKLANPAADTSVTMHFTSVFFDNDQFVNGVMVIGNGAEEDFFDPYGFSQSAIMSSFIALTGVLFAMATTGQSNAFGPLHGIYNVAARNLIDIVQFWSELNPSGTPAESDAILVRGTFGQLVEIFQNTRNAALELISNELTIERVSTFRGALFTAINDITLRGQNIFVTEAGFIHNPLFFGDLIRLLRDKRFGVQRGLSLKAKPYTFNVYELPVMRDSNSTAAVKSWANSSLNVILENLMRYIASGGR